MPVELANQFPFSVDTWSTVSGRKPHHFLTHAHSDHTAGMERHAKYPIYCSLLTMKLILRRHPHLQENLFITLELEEPMLIAGDEPFTVTAFDANHCAGAVMLLFEGDFGNVLHTGDCRLSVDCLLQLPRKYLNQGGSAISTLDYIFLDCTFAKEHVKMPSKRDAIQQVLNCIWAHPKAPTVYLACDLLGHEELLQAISNSFGIKIYVDKDILPDYFADMKIVAPELITPAIESTKFQICEGFPKLHEKAKQSFAQAYATLQEEPLFIRPSAQWYTYKERLEGAGSGVFMQNIPKKSCATRQYRVITPTDAQRDQFGVWHVCYSIHSSRDELEKALNLLCYNNVISTTDSPITGLFSWCVGRSLQENQVKRVKSLGSEAQQIINTQSLIGESQRVLSVKSPKSKSSSCIPSKADNFSAQCAAGAENSESGSAGQPVEKGASEELYLFGSKTHQSQPKITFFDKSLPLFGVARQWLLTTPPLHSMYEDWTSKGEPHGDKTPTNEAANILGCPSKEFEADPTVKVSSNVNCYTTKQPGAGISLDLKHNSSVREATVHMGSCLRNNLESHMEQESSVESPQIECLKEISNVASKEEARSSLSSKSWKQPDSFPGMVKPSTRNLYRMLHVSVPRPLPSLLDMRHNNAVPKFRS